MLASSGSFAPEPRPPRSQGRVVRAAGLRAPSRPCALRSRVTGVRCIGSSSCGSAGALGRWRVAETLAVVCHDVVYTDDTRHRREAPTGAEGQHRTRPPLAAPTEHVARSEAPMMAPSSISPDSKASTPLRYRIIPSGVPVPPSPALLASHEPSSDLSHVPLLLGGPILDDAVVENHRDVAPMNLPHESTARETSASAPRSAFSFLRMFLMRALLSLETSVAVFTYPTLSRSK